MKRLIILILLITALVACSSTEDADKAEKENAKAKETEVTKDENEKEEKKEVKEAEVEKENKEVKEAEVEKEPAKEEPKEDATKEEDKSAKETEEKPADKPKEKPVKNPDKKTEKKEDKKSEVKNEKVEVAAENIIWAQINRDYGVLKNYLGQNISLNEKNNTLNIKNVDHPHNAELLKDIKKGDLEHRFTHDGGQDKIVGFAVTNYETEMSYTIDLTMRVGKDSWKMLNMQINK